MKRLLKGSWSLLIVLSVLVTQAAFAQDLILEFDPDEFVSEDEIQAEASRSPLPEESLSLVRTDYLQGYQQLFQLNEQEIAGFEALLQPLKEDLSTLDAQLQVLQQQQQRLAQLSGYLSQKQVALHDLASRLRVQQQLLQLDIRSLLKRFEKQLVLYYQIKRQYIDEHGDLALLQLFVNADEPADLLMQDYLLGKLQEEIMNQVFTLSLQQYQLQELASSLQKIQDQYDSYEMRLAKSGEVIAQQTSYQQELLADKEREQDFFQLKLEESREEQVRIIQRVQELAGNFQYQQPAVFPLESMIWPVAPVLGISAHYDDQAYYQRFGFHHYAIDIPTDQLTPIKAPLSGTVLEVSDGGLGYSYLQLGHADGLSTVYGHVYSFLVEEGDQVLQGQTIALSGGGIGTKGAGRMTTGPHLHFEVLKDGEHVDPLPYLPELSTQ